MIFKVIRCCFFPPPGFHSGISVHSLSSSVRSDLSYTPKTRTWCKARAQHISWSHVLTRLLLRPQATTSVTSQHLWSPLQLPYHIPPPPIHPEPPPPVACTPHDKNFDLDVTWISLERYLDVFVRNLNVFRSYLNGFGRYLDWPVSNLNVFLKFLDRSKKNFNRSYTHIWYYYYTIWIELI